MSSNRKKTAIKVFSVRAKRLSAVQMKSTGTMIAPSNIRRMMVIFSLRLDIFAWGMGHGVKKRCEMWNTAYCAKRPEPVKGLTA